MAVVLKNSLVELQVDLPFENYQGTRFDWTGKIVALKYKHQQISGAEIQGPAQSLSSGRGFYSEFGIKNPVGYAEIPIGAWFPKIGIGLLKKIDSKYDFTKTYEVQPAHFEWKIEQDQLSLVCQSDLCNGFAYRLKKQIKLLNNGFRIGYQLENTGEKTISTTEYTHNFLALNQDFIGSHYELEFPFEIKPDLFLETINPEQAVEFGTNKIHFNQQPSQAFFFSNLSGDEQVEAKWTLINTKSRIGISETTDFQTNAIELWGTQHVISPELYLRINVKPQSFKAWSRTYQVFEL